MSFQLLHTDLRPPSSCFLFGSLDYYLAAIGNRNWSSVTVLTHSERKEEVNPIFLLLDMLAKSGALGPNVNAFMVSSTWPFCDF